MGVPSSTSTTSSTSIITVVVQFAPATTNPPPPPPPTRTMMPTYAVGGRCGPRGGVRRDPDQLLTAYQLSPITVERKKSVLLAKHKDTNIPTMMEPFSPPAAWF